MLHSTNWRNFIVWSPLLLEILGSMCITIACFLDCDVIKFKINLNFHIIKPFGYMTKKSRQNKYLENKTSFWGEIKRNEGKLCSYEKYYHHNYPNPEELLTKILELIWKWGQFNRFLLSTYLPIISTSQEDLTAITTISSSDSTIFNKNLKLVY